MTSSERKQLLDDLAIDFLIEKEKNIVWGREPSESYTFTKGKLVGACTALGLNFEESDGILTIFTRERRKIVTQVEI
ncbi:hypothetical protein POF51_26500 [Brevibacillus sp. AG]|uniref:hypothetical protein n=1 Tax=Brevibacillus sp. AG TaxID=3020891 RepID=UPI00232ED3C1|nr:hypothetical protein [Brevibacillus sp. AG]MDC0764275.1 hypothetical protein [Brevibacillus sp. AG]